MTNTTPPTELPDGPSLDATRGNVRRSLPGLLLFEAYYRLLGIAAIGPLAAWLFARFIMLSGSPAVSNTEAIDFATTPIGLLGLLIAMTCFVAVVFVEWAGLYDLLDAAAARRAHPTTEILYRSFSLSPRFAVLGLLQLAIALLAILPFALAVGILKKVMLSAHDINYYLTVKPAEFIWSIVIATPFLLVCTFLALRLYLQWVLALPLVILEDRGPREALRESRDLMVGRKFKLGISLAGWWTLCIVVGNGLVFLVKLAGRGILPFAPARIVPQLIVLGIIFSACILTAFIVSALSITGHTALIWMLHRRLVPRNPNRTIGRGKATPLGRRTIIWLSMLALLVLAGVGAFRLMEVTRYESTVLIVAHRGASRHAPENTLSSIREAIRQGADCSEIDVQSTVDGVVILMHDSDLKRIADLPQRVDETTFEEIRKLDAGAWFGEEFEGEKVPTLQEAMNVARGKIHLNIEVKPYGEDPSSAAVVAELIKKNKFADQCVVTSFDANVLRAIKAEVPDLQVGLIVGAAMGDLSKVDADFLSVHAPIVDARFMKRCRERDKEVYTWTVNNREQMIRLTILGVNAIITDEPGVLHELRQRYEELTHSERVLLTFRLWLAQ